MMDSTQGVLEATIASAEQGPQHVGSNDWLKVAVQVAGVGLRLELQVVGQGVALCIVGVVPDRDQADQILHQEVLPLPAEVLAQAAARRKG
jgi:hypothetical protein